MKLFLLIIVIVVLIYYFWKNKIIIDFKSFFERGFVPNREKFGVYCYHGKQGKGKTFSVVEFLLENKGKKIYSNITSIKGIEYTKINGIKDLLDLRSETDCIIVFDEIFTILQKNSKFNGELMDFLSQMRKRKIIFITTAQEWLEIPMTLRRYCRYEIDCNMRKFLWFGIMIKRFGDAEQMHWSQLDNEYIDPIVATKISKCRIRIGESYDTFEQIGKNNGVVVISHDTPNN